MYNIPAGEVGLPEGASGQGRGGAGEGVNGFGNARYDGPQPPKGHGPHHYHFRLAALDVRRLDVPASAKAEDVWTKAQPHIIAEAEVVGVFER
jgi:Raf kinase inhibitor-like YbhB/YbcL family protein